MPPVRTSVPVPALVTLVAAPERIEEMVLDELLVVIVDAAARLIVPPERTIAPDPEAKVMPPVATVPLTMMVPAPRPLASLPKLTVSAVVVVMLALGAVVPLLPVVHPWVELPMVGSAHVPVAVPYPAAVVLPSQ